MRCGAVRPFSTAKLLRSDRMVPAISIRCSSIVIGPIFTRVICSSLTETIYGNCPLLERKRQLRAIMPKIDSRVLYSDHIAERGRDLFRAACSRDLEGIVGKYAGGIYQSEGRSTSWLKIKNPGYSQLEGRHELFEERLSGPTRRPGRSTRPELRLI